MPVKGSAHSDLWRALPQPLLARDPSYVYSSYLPEQMSNAQVSATEVPREGGHPWLQGVGYVLVLAVVLGAVYWKILRARGIQWWDDANYSHGFLVPLLSLYLVWQQRAALRTLPRAGNSIGIVVVFGGI